jgi:hypothetical protein
MKSATNLLAAPLLAVSAMAQFVPAPTDLIQKEGYANISVRYKEVPAGICELDPNVKSYSGYADVGEDQHVFWWFFEARNQDPSDAPLTVSKFYERSACDIHTDCRAPGLDQWRPRIKLNDRALPRAGTVWCWTRHEAL